MDLWSDIKSRIKNAVYVQTVFDRTTLVEPSPTPIDSPQQEFSNAIYRTIGDTLSNAPKVILILSVIHLDGLDQAVEGGGSHAAGM